MRILKRLIKERVNQPGRRGKEEGSMIMEVDEVTHELMLKEKKLNVGWRKCLIFDHIVMSRSI